MINYPGVLHVSVAPGYAPTCLSTCRTCSVHPRLQAS